MKFYLVLLLAVAITGVNMSQSKLKKEDLKTNKDKISYSIGINIGKNMKMQQIDVDADILSQGLKDALSTDTTAQPLLSESEMNQVMTAFQQEMTSKQSEKQKVVGDKNKAEGEKFLAENKTKEGVVALPSGLQYKVIKSGEGKSPKAEDKVTVHYTGTLIDGTVFDSSVERGEPISFPVNGVIKGWTEALQLMKEGDKWELYIPSDLAYGEAGAGGQIGPNAVLVFTVELIKVN